MLGITTVITTVIGTLLGAIKDYMMFSRKVAHEKEMALFRKAGLIVEDQNDARQMQSTAVQFTRRIIVITFMAIILAPVVMLIINPDMSIYVPIKKTEGAWSFLFGLFSGGPIEAYEYIKIQGYVYLVPIMDMLGFIIGFYFGNGGSSSRY